MIFLIFLVSLGTIHVILSSDEKQKARKIKTPPTARAIPVAPAVAPAEAASATEGVWSLMQALEQHGRGETPGTEVPNTPIVGKIGSKDC